LLQTIRDGRQSIRGNDNDTERKWLNELNDHLSSSRPVDQVENSNNKQVTNKSNFVEE